LHVRELKSFQLQGGLRPPTPDQGLCPWTPLGALPQDPRHRLALHALAMCPPKMPMAPLAPVLWRRRWIDWLINWLIDWSTGTSERWACRSWQCRPVTSDLTCTLPSEHPSHTIDKQIINKFPRNRNLNVALNNWCKATRGYQCSQTFTTTYRPDLHSHLAIWHCWSVLRTRLICNVSQRRSVRPSFIAKSKQNRNTVTMEHCGFK